MFINVPHRASSYVSCTYRFIKDFEKIFLQQSIIIEPESQSTELKFVKKIGGKMIREDLAWMMEENWIWWCL